MLAEAGLVEKASSLIHTHIVCPMMDKGARAWGNEELVSEERELS